MSKVFVNAFDAHIDDFPAVDYFHPPKPRGVKQTNADRVRGGRMMSKCENCRLRKESAKAFDIHWHGEDDCPYDKCPLPNFPKTNADSVRNMTDEELADMFVDIGECDRRCPAKLGDCIFSDSSCRSAWLDWLKEATE